MPKTDKRVDDYIKKAHPFAQPILIHLRKLVRQVCPDVEETIKWGFAAFDYKGPFCSMAAFKQHCAFGFWKAALMKNADKLESNQATAMGHLGKITSLKDLPPDRVIIAYIKEAMKLNEEGKKLPPRKKIGSKPLSAPPDFIKALSKSKQAVTHFENFAPGKKKEYITWINEAKTNETRNKRVAQAVEWISEGKNRNWKYLKK